MSQCENPNFTLVCCDRVTVLPTPPGRGTSPGMARRDIPCRSSAIRLGAPKRTQTQRCFNAGPAFKTLARHWNSTASACAGTGAELRHFRSRQRVHYRGVKAYVSGRSRLPVLKVMYDDLAVTGRCRQQQLISSGPIPAQRLQRWPNRY